MYQKYKQNISKTYKKYCIYIYNHNIFEFKHSKARSRLTFLKDAP